MQATSCSLIKKRDFNTGVFLWILQNFKNTSFTEHLRANASISKLLQFLLQRKPWHDLVFCYFVCEVKMYFGCVSQLPTINKKHIELSEKCSNTEFFLVRLFLYYDWIQENIDHKKIPYFLKFERIMALVVDDYL